MGISQSRPGGLNIGEGLYIGSPGSDVKIINSSGAFVGSTAFNISNLTTTGNTTLGNASAIDTLTVNAVSTFGNNLSVLRSTTGSLLVEFNNNSLTAGDMTLLIDVDGTGVPAVVFERPGGNWTMGQYTNESFRIAQSSGDLNSNVRLTIDATTGAVAMKGTTAVGSATAGNIGEVIQATSSAALNVAATGERFDIKSIPLTAGDWLVSGLCYYNKGTATITVNSSYELMITATSGNNTTGATLGDNYVVQDWMNASADEQSMSIPMYRINISSSATYYLKGRALYTAGQPTVRGRITALRIR